MTEFNTSNMTVGRPWLIHILVVYLDSILEKGMPFTWLSQFSL